MLPLVITIPLALILLLFCVVFSAVSVGLVVGAVVLNLSSWRRRERWQHKLGSAIGGVIIGGFGWVILQGAWVTGSDIITGLITRFIA